MKKILVTVVLILIAAVIFGQKPFKIKNVEIKQVWGADSMSGILGTTYYNFFTNKDGFRFNGKLLVDTLITLSIVASDTSNYWTMTGNKLSPTIPTNYVNSDSSYYLKGIDFIRLNNYSIMIGELAGNGLDSTEASILIGTNAGEPYTGGSANYATIVGNNAGAGCDDDNINYSTLIGANAGAGSEAGNGIELYSVGIGRSALNATRGIRNIGIGVNSGLSSYLMDSVLHISSWGYPNSDTLSGIWGQFKKNNARLRINSDLTVTEDLNVTGDLTYDFIHADGSADSLVGFSVGGTQFVYYKIATGAMTWHEADGVTAVADSVTIIAPGHYRVHCWLNATTSNANDQIKTALFINDTISINGARWIINSGGTGIGETKYFMWYRDLAADDVLDIRTSNITGARAVSVVDFQLYIEKVPE